MSILNVINSLALTWPDAVSALPKCNIPPSTVVVPAKVALPELSIVLVFPFGWKLTSPPSGLIFNAEVAPLFLAIISLLSIIMFVPLVVPAWKAWSVLPTLASPVDVNLPWVAVTLPAKVAAVASILAISVPLV